MTFNEQEHPRGAGARFVEKGQSEPELELGGTDRIALLDLMRSSPDLAAVFALPRGTSAPVEADMETVELVTKREATLADWVSNPGEAWGMEPCTPGLFNQVKVVVTPAYRRFWCIISHPWSSRGTCPPATPSRAASPCP